MKSYSWSQSPNIFQMLHYSKKTFMLSKSIYCTDKRERKLFGIAITLRHQLSFSKDAHYKPSTFISVPQMAGASLGKLCRS